MREYFGDIELVWLVIVPFAMLGLGWWDLRNRRRVLASFVTLNLVPTMVRGTIPGRRRLKIILRALAVLFIAVALMRPQWGIRDTQVIRRGIDLVFVVDTSKSMWARDVTPNRMERVKADLRYFADEVVQHDRIALVAFAGTARTLCPLTLDHAAFDIFLDDLDVGIIPRGGTSFRAAIQAALAAFGDDVRNHKAVVLFSDGEAHDGVPEDLLETARSQGVRIYTVGIGSEEGVRIPVATDGDSETFLKDGEGNIVLSRLDDRVLKTIAQRSLDGAYTHLSAGRSNLEKIYLDNIKKIEERELQSSQQERRVERFQWFLAFALLLLMSESVLPDGRIDKGVRS